VNGAARAIRADGEQVDDALFKVPRALLLGSPVFEQMFALPQSGPSDGDSKENPLKLEGVTVEEFGLFVRAALAQYVCPCDRDLGASRADPAVDRPARRRT
jgi:hypothetical protein